MILLERILIREIKWLLNSLGIHQEFFKNLSDTSDWKCWKLRNKVWIVSTLSFNFSNQNFVRGANSQNQKFLLLGMSVRDIQSKCQKISYWSTFKLWKKVLILSLEDYYVVSTRTGNILHGKVTALVELFLKWVSRTVTQLTNYTSKLFSSLFSLIFLSKHISLYH